MNNTTNTLFNLGDKAAALYDLLTNERLDETGAPVTFTEGEQSAIIDAYLEAEGDVHQKVDGYCALIAEFTMRAEARAAEANRLTALCKRDTARAESLKARLKFYFEFHSIKKMETPRHSLSLVNNGGKLPVVIAESVNPDDLEEQFQRTIPARIEIDKEAVREELESGGKLDFATLGQRGTQLKIK